MSMQIPKIFHVLNHTAKYVTIHQFFFKPQSSLKLVVDKKPVGECIHLACTYAHSHTHTDGWTDRKCNASGSPQNEWLGQKYLQTLQILWVPAVARRYKQCRNWFLFDYAECFEFPSVLWHFKIGRQKRRLVTRNRGWLGSRVVSVLDSREEEPGFKSQSLRCRVTVLGKLFTPIMPLFTKQQNW